jgi:acyl carrier protein phosphodiesterase
VNYLAHFQLANQIAEQCGLDRSGLMIGGLLGDFVKGPLRGDYPSAWETGIRLHRRIDALTDSHPLVVSCLEQLPADYRRYGGIMLDVCFDHCLSLHWDEFHQGELGDFCQQSYAAVLQEKDSYPTPAKRQIGFLAEYDVLSQMHHWATIETMLGGIGHRVKRSNPLAGCGPELARLLPFIDQQFCALYPALLNQLKTEFTPKSH